MLDSVGDHSLEPSPRPLQFFLYKGVAHRREGSPTPYFTFYQACLYVGGGVLPGLRVRGKLDVLPTSGSTVFYLLSSSQPGTVL